MRITNMMMQNNMMLNVNRNAQLTNDLYGQITSGKKISLPSQDPIIASRALRFRTSVAATEQYMRNNDQAISWTSTTATAYENTITSLKDISEILTKGSTDTMSLSERKDIATSIKAYLEDIKAQMNSTYAGRYVFSGYRTDEPPILTADSNKAYTINEDISYADMMTGKSYWKKDNETMASMSDISSIRLPYAFAKNITLNNQDGTATGFTVTHGTTGGATDPYTTPALGDNEARYIDETGELLLGKNVQAALLQGDMTLNYDKENFLKGELNPKVNFECIERTGGITETNPASGSAIKDPVSGIYTSADASGNLVQRIRNGAPAVDNLGNPIYESFTMDGQDLMSYELSYRTRIQINSLGKDSLTDNMFADIARSASRVLEMEISTEAALKTKYMAQGLTGDELDAAIEAQISKETTQISAIVQDEFGTMLDKIKSHSSLIAREQTDLATRQVRLDVLQGRLEDDYLNFTTLMSNNEDVEYEDAVSKMSMAEAVYEAALKMTGKITQMSILNYM